MDSSLGTSVALVGATRIVATASDDNTRGHAEVIGTLIERVLGEAHARPSDITMVASGVGPGPFTGLRVGMAAARAFAFACDVPEVGVDSHDAAALEWLEHHYARARTGLGELTPDLVVATDARRKQLFVSRYAGLDDDWLPRRIEGPGLAEAADENVTWVRPSRIPAGYLGLIAARRLAAGRPQGQPNPQYLRDPDVTPSNGPKRVLQ